MPDDPLTKPVEDWTQLDLGQLLGAAESEYLELKGNDVDINLPSGRSLLARAVAGLMSAAGGYLIVGATSGVDTVEGYPGIDANADELDALVRSLQDRVRPHALFRGPLTFDGEDDEKVVLVFQVFRHPAGLPIAADGVFWIRTGSETRRMDYSEVRRRFGQVSDFTSDAVEQADRAASKAAEPFRSEYRRTAGQRGHPELQLEPLTVACIPIAAPRDLGMSGTELLAAFRESVDRIASAFVAHLSDPLPDLAEGARATVDGIVASSDGLQVIHLGHDGVYSAAWATVVEPFSSGSGASQQYVEVVSGLLVALGLDVIGSLIGPVTVHVSLSSGSIRGLPPAGGADQSGIIGRHEYASPSAGSDAVAATAHGCRLLVARAFEGVGQPPGSAEPGLDTFLDVVLARDHRPQ